jgi:hypothetical protein
MSRFVKKVAHFLFANAGGINRKIPAFTPAAGILHKPGCNNKLDLLPLLY